MLQMQLRAGNHRKRKNQQQILPAAPTCAHEYSHSVSHPLSHLRSHTYFRQTCMLSRRRMRTEGA